MNIDDAIWELGEKNSSLGKAIRLSIRNIENYIYYGWSRKQKMPVLLKVKAKKH